MSDTNRMRLLWAGFMAILAAGVGFAIRGGIFDNWAGEYGFTAGQLGAIGGAGFTGFCFGIIIGGVIVDKIGYGKLVILACAAHVLSAFVTFGASSPENAYNMLFWGMFIFAYANGTLEAVANPLVATLFPENRTHYLNILHASWPAGLVLGSAVGWVLDDILEWNWKYQLALYLIPTLIYGAMFFGQNMPKSEASAKGMKLGDMFKDVGILGGLVVCYLLALFFGGLFENPIIGYAIGGGLLVAIGVITNFSIGSFMLFVLFVAHALIGAVELGTDQWAQNITGNLFTSEEGKWLFIWTSAIMFGLRFAANWLESTLKISPIMLLFLCSVLACLGLQLSSTMTTFTVALGALGVYAVGKTFFWPTMLAVASDRFPRTGAVAISIMGGIGMMSAGLVGSSGLGYAKDRFTSEELKETNAALYEESKAEKPSDFLGIKASEIYPVDGTKLSDAKKAVADAKKAGNTPDSNQLAMAEADQRGDRRTLKADSYIPGAMAVIYLLLLLYFRSQGGYKVVSIDGDSEDSGGESEGSSDDAGDASSEDSSDDNSGDADSSSEDAENSEEKEENA